MGATFSVLGAALRKRIERLEELLEIVRASGGGGGSATFGADGCFDIRDFGALATPNDIGPAVQLAANAAIARGGGMVCIPPVPPGVVTAVPDQWGWSTPVIVNLNTDKNFALQGIVGGTMIRVSGGGQIFSVGNNGPGIVSIDGLIFTGDPTIGLDAPNVIDISQTRTARLTRCEFWGLDCNADLNGVVHIVADTVHVEDNIWVGCNFSGTPRKGGVLCISGMRDGCLVTTNRFDANGIQLNGQLYGKAGTSPQSGWLWFGGQGPAPPPTQPAYGGVDVIANHFSQIVQLFQLGFLPDEQDPTFIIANARVIGNSFNTPTVNLNPAASLLSSNALRVFVRGEFAGAQAGFDAVKIQNCDHVIFQDSRFALENLNINFTGPVGYCEFDECPKVAIPAYAVAAAAYGPTLTNIQNVQNVSEKLNGAAHALICDPRTLATGVIEAWYDASLGITLNGANVAQWDDSSGVGDPNQNLVQAVAAQQPPYVASNPTFNGQASIGPFDPVANQFLASGIWATPPTTTGLIIAVFRTATAGVEIVLRDVGAADWELYQNATSDIHWFLNAILAIPMRDINAPTIIAIDQNGPATKVFQDGLTPLKSGTLTTPGTAAPVGLTVSLAGGGFAGEVAYFVFFRSRPSHEDFQRLMESLGVRYAIPAAA